MRRKWAAMVAGAVVGGVFLGAQQPAHARKQYYKAFQAHYAGADADPKFVAAVQHARCNVCHNPHTRTPDGMTSKKFRNAYGEALDALLDKGDKSNTQKIAEALETVGQQQTSEGITYDALFRGGRLPDNPQ